MAPKGRIVGGSILEALGFTDSTAASAFSRRPCVSDLRRPDMTRVGDTFAVPLDDTRLGAVRVIRVDQEQAEMMSLVATTCWTGTELPRATEPLLRTTVRRFRARYKGEPAICWYEGSPPDEFTYIGYVEPSDEERTFDARGTFCGHLARVNGQGRPP